MELEANYWVDGFKKPLNRNRHNAQRWI